MSGKKVEFEDGYIDVNGIKIFYKRFGKGNSHKLLALHGGPGGTHDYILPIADLASMDFDIVFYDQFGCGKSDYPKNEADYSLEYAVEEVEGVRKTFFGDSKINLFGNSWGGMLALAYALKYQDRLSTLTSSSGLASVPDTVSEMHRLISLMPEKHRKAIEKHEAERNYDHPDYLAATNYFMRQHLLRMDSIPPEVSRMMLMTNERGTYLKMNGPSEFTIIGLIRDIDFTDKLHTIKVPTLITCGKYDEVTPQIAATIHHRILNSELEIFQESSHLQFWEERDKYMQVLSSFIKAHDR